MGKCVLCGKKGMFFKVNDMGLCDQCADIKTKSDRILKLESELDQAKQNQESERKYRAELEGMITPEMQKADSLRRMIEELTQTKERLDLEIAGKNNLLKSLNNQILVAEDAIEMESFSLYKPEYNFVSSEEYKAKLDEIRADQKRMLKNGTAATCETDWTVRGSKTDGKRMANEIIKLFLRAFNNECEAAVRDVKFNNFERCSQRIEKSYEQINNLGKVNTVSISHVYCYLKHRELRLAYEYALKKQQEKEEQAEIRRQQREQAKLDKEIAEARKAAEKERQHYEQALASIDAQIAACDDAEHKAELLERRAEIRNGLEGVEAKLEDIDYRQANQRAGYVYIISNIGAFGENVYKIGMTRRLNPMERIDELGDASVPFTFDVHAMIFSSDAPALEAALHRAFEDRRINKVNTRREYFRVTLEEIKDVVRDNHDKSVEFIDVPAAEQYRQSIRM